jgi:periplasmic protein TonB
MGCWSLLLRISKEYAISGSMFRLKEKMISSSTYAAILEKRSDGMLMLIAILVLLLHVMAILWLRQSKDLPSEYNTPLPFKLEVTLLAKDSSKSSVVPTPANYQPKPKVKPEPKAKPKPKPEPKKTPPVKEKLPNLGEIEKLIKSQSVKQVSKSVKYEPDQQTAHTVASAMITPLAGSASARDNFPISDLHNPSPEYPEMAIFLGYQGNAIVRIKVSAKGLSEGVDILRSSGHKILDEATTKALKKWRFTPSKHGNTPMASSVVISVIYILYDRNS